MARALCGLRSRPDVRRVTRLSLPSVLHGLPTMQFQAARHLCEKKFPQAHLIAVIAVIALIALIAVIAAIALIAVIVAIVAIVAIAVIVAIVAIAAIGVIAVIAVIAGSIALQHAIGFQRALTYALAIQL